MRPEGLHGPTEDDRCALRAIAAARRGMAPAPPSWAADEALALAAADRRNGFAARGLAWLAWAYNRSPLREAVELLDWPPLILEGVLPPLGRWLAFLSLPADRAAAYRLAARNAPRRNSGWAGCLVALPVWVEVTALVLWALTASVSGG
ncbi:hypothetical protein [Roseomonas sp. BN140053]|uniref:hypothetical protein n=1 Tax=Roseomonas sp. BN140053 TaxID=3391898 RepID=UPI0039EA0D4D